MNLFSLNNILRSNIYLRSLKERKKYINIYFFYKNYCVLNINYISTQLIKLYIYLYKITLIEEHILFINTRKLSSSIIKEISFITKNYYFNNNWKKGFITNWYLYQKKYILFKWLFLILNFIFTNKHLINFKIIKPLLNSFFYLNYYYSGILGMYSLPKIIILLKTNKDKYYVKEFNKSNIIILDLMNNNINNFLNIPITNLNKLSLNLILQIITLAILKAYLKY